MAEKIAIIRVRGGIRVNTKVIDTLQMLKLYRQNYCVVYEKTPSIVGMVQKIKDYITWGEISDENIKLLEEKRGEIDHSSPNKGKGKKEIKDNKKISDKPTEKKELKKFFRLNPPVGGFERKGIKKAFGAGGALGYRGEKINDLIKKMI